MHLPALKQERRPYAPMARSQLPSSPGGVVRYYQRRKPATVLEG
ncbi:hypothetical protein ACQUSR_21830 [Streptomyces sp. P1-3]